MLSGEPKPKFNQLNGSQFKEWLLNHIAVIAKEHAKFLECIQSYFNQTFWSCVLELQIFIQVLYLRFREVSHLATAPKSFDGTKLIIKNIF